MEFSFTTDYTIKALTVMVKAVRKTAGKKRSRRTHFFGILVVLLALLLSLSGGFVPDGKTLVTLLAGAAVALTLLFEDRLNGAIAKKRMLPGSERAVASFRPDGYHTETAAASSDFPYGTITAIAETRDYFVFLLGKNYGQIYDKRSITGGTAEEFRSFMESATGKTMQRI